MFEERRLSNISEAENLIRRCNLTIDYNVDYTVGIFSNNELVATGSLLGDMIQMLAVSPDYRGEDLSAIVITHLIRRAQEMKMPNLHLYTKPENIQIFVPLGFNIVAIAKPFAALLEWGYPGITEYCHDILAQARDVSNPVSAIVMNCNPFTLGHLYLIEQAAARSSKVVVLVVEENLSIFPFDVRYRLICEGTSHLPNVVVIAGGRYIVSSLTFPSYFSKDKQHAIAHSAIDVEIFLKHIVPTLNITARYVGTEPYSPVTAIYNNTMKERLIPAAIEVIELLRMEKAGIAVSASLVRMLLTHGDITAVKEFIPKCTYNYITSDAAITVLNKLKNNNQI